MNFILNPSLKHIALVQVAAILWNEHDVNKHLVREFSCSLCISESNFFPYPHYLCKRYDEWKMIEDSVIDKVSELTIPASLKEKLSCYIQPIGIQILRWIDYHFRFCGFDFGLLNNLCWTPNGTLDKKKTAEVLIRDEAIDITVRYRLACAYCLEDAIPELFYRKIDNHKIFYYTGSILSKFERELLMFWKQYMEKNFSRCTIIRKSNNIYFSDSYMLQCATEAGNIAATKYFLQKLIKQECSLDEVLMNAAISAAKKSHKSVLDFNDSPQEYYSEFFCFILSQISNEQQVQLFEICPVEALQCLLDWPWQKIFVKTVSLLFNFLPDSYAVLKTITHKLDIGYKDYNYQKIFQDVWQLIPHAQKLYIINDNCPIVLNSLLKVKDHEIIKFIFLDINLTERKEFIFSSMGQLFCEYLIYSEEWDLLKFFVPLCISSKDEMLKFQKKFQKNIQRKKKATDMLSKKTFGRNRNKLEGFFQLLNDLVHKYDKRKSLDDGNSNPAKKFGNIEF